MVDSCSDGMCGWVAMEDTETRRKARVSWSVTNLSYRSQDAAREEALRRLMASPDSAPHTEEGAS